MRQLRERVQMELEGVLASELSGRIRALMASVTPEEFTPEVAAAGLREATYTDQYFWIELASRFPTAPEVIKAAVGLLARSDSQIANHLIVDLLAESNDTSVAAALGPVIAEPQDFDEQEGLCIRALFALFAVDQERARRFCAKHDWFVGRENLAIAAKELFEPDDPAGAQSG